MTPAVDVLSVAKRLHTRAMRAFKKVGGASEFGELFAAAFDVCLAELVAEDLETAEAT